MSSDTSTSTSTGTPSPSTTSFSDLGRDMWSYLTGQEAAIDYMFVDMTVEVPRSTGPDSARATLKLNGTLRITTQDKDNRGAVSNGTRV